MMPDRKQALRQVRYQGQIRCSSMQSSDPLTPGVNRLQANGRT
jgi:hypothetical protein